MHTCAISGSLSSAFQKWNTSCVCSITAVMEMLTGWLFFSIQKLSEPLNTTLVF